MTAGGIIVEGCDQQGKTTFCALLQKKLGYGIYHFNAPGPYTDFSKEYTELLKYDDFIFDRSYLSEMVYGPLFRGKSGITPELQRQIECEFIQRGYIMVYLKRKNFMPETRAEMYKNDEIMRAYHAYDKAYETVSMPKITVDAFDDDALDQVLQFRSRLFKNGRKKN